MTKRIARFGMAKDNGILGVAQACGAAGQDCHRSGVDCAGCKGRTVDLCSWKGGEQIVRADQAGVQLNIGNGAIIGATLDG